MRTEEEIRELLQKAKEEIKNVPEMQKAIFSQNPLYAGLKSIIDTIEWVLNESEVKDVN